MLNKTDEIVSLDNMPMSQAEFVSQFEEFLDKYKFRAVLRQTLEDTVLNNQRLYEMYFHGDEKADHIFKMFEILVFTMLDTLEMYDDN